MAFLHGAGTSLVLRPASPPGLGGSGGPSAGAATRLLRRGSLQARLWKAHAGGSRETSREGRLPCTQLQKDSGLFFF